MATKGAINGMAFAHRRQGFLGSDVRLLWTECGILQTQFRQGGFLKYVCSANHPVCSRTLSLASTTPCAEVFTGGVLCTADWCQRVARCVPAAAESYKGVLRVKASFERHTNVKREFPADVAGPSLSGASQTPIRARGRFILLPAGEVGGHTSK
jgi:hypothetical protein